jgi:flagellar basal-body rod protein FlgF
MQTASYVALAQQSALQRSIDETANNIANMSTTGFRGEKTLFQTFLAAGPGGQTIAYVKDTGVLLDTRQGVLTHTGNSLDVAISGGGFFSVDTPDGPRYTRNGKFQINAQRGLTTAQGYSVLDDRGQPITIPNNTKTLSITEAGTISTEQGAVGKLGVVKFDAPQRMVPAADGTFVTEATPTPDTDSTVNQGILESSNIEPINELTRLLGLQRAYQSAQQIGESEDTRIKNAIDKLSRVA